MQMRIAVTFKEVCDTLGLMCRAVIDDDMQRFAAGLVDDEVGEECDELGRGVLRGGLTERLARSGVKGGVERQRAMAAVLKAMALSTAR